MTTNDLEARPDRLKMGRVEVLNKMFPGHVESDNVLEALGELTALNDAHKDVRKVMIIIWFPSYVFINYVSIVFVCQSDSVERLAFCATALVFYTLIHLSKSIFVL